MIINKDGNPERAIYYFGAMIIDELKKHPTRRADFFEIYQVVKKSHNISLNLFSLTLDWLFILGAIKNNEGYIEKCF